MIKVSRLSLLTLPKNMRTETDIFGRRYTIIEKQNETMPRGLEAEFAALLAGITDAQIRERVTRILELARQGWLNQNQPSRSDNETKPEPENLLDPRYGTNPDLLTAPNQTGTMARPGRSGTARLTQLPNPRNNSSANVNAGKKTIKGTLLLSKVSKAPKPSFLLLKHYKCKTGLCKTDIHFVASDSSVDSDNDRFTREQLETWKNQIIGLPLTYDHEHSIKSEIGVITNSDIKCVGDGYCRLEASAKLYDDHEIAQEVKRSAEAGRVLEFSIGATQPKNAVKDRNGVRHISDSNLLHVSIVQSGSNRNAKLIGVEN